MEIKIQWSVTVFSIVHLFNYKIFNDNTFILNDDWRCLFIQFDSARAVRRRGFCQISNVVQKTKVFTSPSHWKTIHSRARERQIISDLTWRILSISKRREKLWHMWINYGVENYCTYIVLGLVYCCVWNCSCCMCC